MKKKLALVLAVIMALSTLAGCSNGGGGESSENNMLAVLLRDEPSTCDPQKTVDYYAVPMNIYDRLIDCKTVDGKATLLPSLAESWDISDDGLVYTFHLRNDVKFHNGEKFKADDVLYTIDRMMKPENETVNTDFYDMIAGANDVFEGKADTVSGVKVIDDQTVEITLAQPFGAFLANLATTACSIFNRKATEEAGEKFGIDTAATVGSGPFILSEWKLNDKLVLKTNKDYWGGASKLDGVIFKNIPDAETQRMAFEKGELDVFNVAAAKSQLPYFKSSPKWKDKIVRGPQAAVTFYSFNVTQPPFDDVNVRKAIAHAIDRQSLLDTIYDGEGELANSVVPKNVIGYNPDIPSYDYDPELAKEYLAKAGYPNGGLKIEIVQQGTGAGTTLDMNVAIQSMLKDVGIEAEITQLDDAAYYQRRADGKMAFESSGWLADYNDPDNFMYTFYSEKKTKYYSINYTRPEVLKNIEDARNEVDVDKRVKMYQDSQRMIVEEDCVAVPMFQLSRLFVVPEYVKNFQIAWNGWADMSFYGIELEGKGETK